MLFVGSFSGSVFCLFVYFGFFVRDDGKLMKLGNHAVDILEYPTYFDWRLPVVLLNTVGECVTSNCRA